MLTQIIRSISRSATYLKYKCRIFVYDMYETIKYISKDIWKFLTYDQTTTLYKQFLLDKLIVDFQPKNSHYSTYGLLNISKPKYEFDVKELNILCKNIPIDTYTYIYEVLRCFNNKYEEKTIELLLNDMKHTSISYNQLLYLLRKYYFTDQKYIILQTKNILECL